MKKVKNCKICHSIPEESFMDYKASELIDGNWPENENKLEIVGAPYVQPHTTGLNSCLKKCPQCGSYFLWSFSYEFLADGSEDEYLLERISFEKGMIKEKKILNEIKEAEVKFRNKAVQKLRTLSTAKSKTKLEHASLFFWDGARIGFDITFALTKILESILSNLFIQKYEIVKDYIDLVFFYYVKNEVMRENLKKIIKDFLKDKSKQEEKKINSIIKRYV